MRKNLVRGLTAIAVAIVAATYSPLTAKAHTRFSTDISWSGEIRDLFEQRCMPCHNPNGAAPDYVDLTFYGTDTKPGAWAWRAAVMDEIMLDRMPPWNADPRFGEFQNSRRLTSEEKQMLIGWIEGNGPQGPLRNLPVPEQFVRPDWQLGQPDLIVGMPQGHIVPADQQFDRATVRVPIAIAEDTYITGYEFLVENPRNVARVTAYIHDPEGFTPQPIEVEMKVPYDPFALTEGPEPTRMRPMPAGPHFLGQWLKGERAVFFPDAAGMKLIAGSTIELTVEYLRPDFADWREDIRDNTRLGLFLAALPDEVDLLVESKRMDAKPFKVPAGKTFEQSVEYVFDENVHLIGFAPELGPIATKFRMSLQYPDGFDKTIIWVPKYQQKWATTYRFASPLEAPEGTKIVLTGYYDNTADNWGNPNDPPQDISSGPGYLDEKLSAYFEYTLDDHLKLDPIVVATEAPVSGGGMLGGFGPDVAEPKDPGAQSVDAATQAVAESLELPQEPEHIRIASNGYHQIQAMMPRPGAVSIFVYDAALNPLDPRNFSGELLLDGGARRVPLVQAHPNDDFLSAWIEPSLPQSFSATLHLGATTETVPFEFDRLTPADNEAGSAASQAYVQPPHGGWLESLETSGVQVEATLQEPGDLRLYFFDSAMKPLSPLNFQVEVVVEGGKSAKQEIPLSQAHPRAEYLGATIPGELPVTVTASVWVGDKQETVTFEFDELTEEPWELDPAVSAAPLVVGPHGSTQFEAFDRTQHFVEAVLPRPGELRVYVYDGWKNAVSPTLFKGEIAAGGTTLPLERFSPDDDFLSAYVSPGLPFAAEATIWIAGASDTFTFEFDDVTRDPASFTDTALAHMDHTPVHGGIFFMAPNNFHHVEGTLPRPGEFRAYFYDEFKRPIDPRNFTATAYIEHLNEATGEVTEDAFPMEVIRPGDPFLTAIVPASFPTTLYARVNLAGEPTRFDFQFDELTIDTGGAMPSTMDMSMPMPGQPGLPGGHSHYRPPMLIPGNVPGILGLIDEKERDLAGRISSGTLVTLYQPALDIRDLVEALTKLNTGADVRAAGKLKLTLSAVNRTVNKLDRAGDTGDGPRAQAALKELSGQLAEIRKLFPANR